jgi:hypothetical protein
MEYLLEQGARVVGAVGYQSISPSMHRVLCRGAEAAFEDAGLPRKTAYRYRVMATGSSGNSPYSNIVTVRTP